MDLVVIFNPFLGVPIIFVIICIFFVFVKLSRKVFLSVKRIITRRRDRTSNNQESQNEDDIEMGIAHKEIRPRNLRQRTISI